MLTSKKLNQFGADTQEGLQRCMGNEALYLKLVNFFLADASFAKLKASLEVKDLDTAFQASHALKGVLGNLSLTPLYQIIFEMTELLRKRSDIDYSDYLKRYENEFANLLVLSKE